MAVVAFHSPLLFGRALAIVDYKTLRIEMKTDIYEIKCSIKW